MEVHHHTHTPRKKWTHYFWEFLMLFLAVTLGFFVENQREHYIERHRAVVLAHSLVEDLKKDTTLLRRTIASCSQKIDDLKDLVILLRNRTSSLNDTLIYKKALPVQYATRFLRAV